MVYAISIFFLMLLLILMVDIFIARVVSVGDERRLVGTRCKSLIFITLVNVTFSQTVYVLVSLPLQPRLFNGLMIGFLTTLSLLLFYYGGRLWQLERIRWSGRKRIAMLSVSLGVSVSLVAIISGFSFVSWLILMIGFCLTLPIIYNEMYLYKKQFGEWPK